VIKRRFLITVFCVLPLLVSCGGGLEIASRWRQANLTIDAADSDWAGSMLYLQKEGVSVGVQNDGEYLYLCLRAHDRRIQQQIMRLGFTVWFDSTASEENILGIHYPIGMQDIRQMREGRAAEGNPEQAERNPEQLQQFRQMLHEMEVIGPGKSDRNRVPVINSYAISIAMSDTSGALVYELRMPLKSAIQRPYAVGTDTGKVINIGLETGEMKRAMMPQGGGMPGGMPGGGGGMPGGGRGGRGGGMGPGGRQTTEGTSEPLKVWMKVEIASSETQKL
jgi:hypothetical protein